MTEASFEALEDGSVELDVDSAAHVCLRFVDDTICIACDGGVCLFLAGEEPFCDLPASGGWHINCHWSMVAWVWPDLPGFARAHEIVLFSTLDP